jgi:hypothetical protein
MEKTKQDVTKLPPNSLAHDIENLKKASREVVKAIQQLGDTMDKFVKDKKNKL